MLIMDLIKTLLGRQNSATFVADCGDIALYHDGDCYWLYGGGEAIQAVCHVKAPTELVLNYQKNMMAALALVSKMPQQVLNLGFGIGAFERCFAAISHPPQQWLAVEQSGALIAQVLQHLPLTQDWPVSHDDAYHFLQNDNGQYDLILVDLFNGQYHAECIDHPDFFTLLASRLTPEGVVTLNLAPRSDEHLMMLLACAKQCFNGGFLGHSEGSANLILILTHKPQQRLQSHATQPKHLNEFGSLNLEKRLQQMHPIFPVTTCTKPR